MKRHLILPLTVAYTEGKETELLLCLFQFAANSVTQASRKRFSKVLAWCRLPFLTAFCHVTLSYLFLLIRQASWGSNRVVKFSFDQYSRTAPFLNNLSMIQAKVSLHLTFFWCSSLLPGPSLFSEGPEITYSGAIFYSVLLGGCIDV